MPLDRAAWLEQAREAFARDHGPRPGRLTVTVRSEDGAESSYVLNGAPAGGPLPALSPFEADVVRVLGGAALTAKAIAARLGRKNTSNFRTLLRNMCERVTPVLVRERGGGYRVATSR
jgi:hypothetical protein